MTAEETRMKLDYEQQCYRQSELIARTRLQQLQKSVEEIPRLHRSWLEPQAPPDCAFKGPLTNPMTAEETRIKLDYEQQRYRQRVRVRLGNYFSVPLSSRSTAPAHRGGPPI